MKNSSHLFVPARQHPRARVGSGTKTQSGARPVVDKVFPLAKTGDALTYVKSRRAKGKVVIAVAD
jgi:NADPH:quinone reductase-like Zn-dependent oxidoreductase